MVKPVHSAAAAATAANLAAFQEQKEHDKQVLKEFVQDDRHFSLVRYALSQSCIARLYLRVSRRTTARPGRVEASWKGGRGEVLDPQTIHVRSHHRNNGILMILPLPCLLDLSYQIGTFGWPTSSPWATGFAERSPSSRAGDTCSPETRHICGTLVTSFLPMQFTCLSRLRLPCA